MTKAFGRVPTPIAFCITELNVGGAERCLVELVTRINPKRFRPVVYVLAHGKAEAPSLVPGLEAAGIEVHCLGASSRWDFPRVTYRLTKLLKRQSPQLLQTFLFHANIVGRLAGSIARTPHIVSGIRVAERRHRWYLTLDRLTAGRVARHVCVSQSVADFSRTMGGLPAERLVVIPNGIDFSRYGPDLQPADLEPLGIPRGRKVMIYVGRLDEQKGVRWLIEQSRDLLTALPGYDLVMVGDGPERALLKSFARRSPVADRIHFAGWRPDVPQLLKASSLFIFPSRWEGMPNVLLEAMASGLPVLATSVEGVSELLGPGVEQQTVAYGDSEGLIHKAVALARDDIGPGLGTANRLRAQAEFSIDAMVARYEALYDDLLTH